jgi:HD-GYP domain-containing protein (c-di-GMP phosphodiesterase class II)
MRVLMRATHAWLLQADKGLASTLSERVLRCARISGDPIHMRMALHLRAGVADSQRDFDGAVQLLLSALRILRLSDDAKGEVLTLLNLGAAVGRLGLRSRALHFSEKALETYLEHAEKFGQADQFELETVLRCNLIGSLTGAGEYRRAVVEAARFHELPLPTSVSLTTSAGTQIAMARDQIDLFALTCLIRLNSPSDASVAAARISAKLGTGAIFDRNVVHAKWVLAQHRAYVGQISEAISELETVLADEDAAEIQVDATEDLARCYERAGRFEEALEIVKKLRQEIFEVRQRAMIAGVKWVDDVDLWADESFEKGLERILTDSYVTRMGSDLMRKIESLIRLTLSGEEGTQDHGHARRVGQLCGLLARRIGRTEGDVWKAGIAGSLHDLGMCAMPRQLIHSNDLRARLAKDHVVFGARLIMAADTEKLQDVSQAVLHHHENFDGTGFPDGLQGESIPLLARIVRIADEFDQRKTDMHRNDRTAHVSEVLKEMIASNTELDPVLLHEFASAVTQFASGDAEVLETISTLR